MIAVVAWAVLGSSAWADAFVLVKSDEVLVNHGTGFLQVTGVTEVKPGDLVMAWEDGVVSGHGYILYPDCDEEVRPGRVHTVEDRPGEVGDLKELRTICREAAVPLWVWGGVAVGAVAVCVGVSCFGDDDEPTSP